MISVIGVMETGTDGICVGCSEFSGDCEDDVIVGSVLTAEVGKIVVVIGISVGFSVGTLQDTRITTRQKRVVLLLMIFIFTFPLPPHF